MCKKTTLISLTTLLFLVITGRCIADEELAAQKDRVVLHIAANNQAKANAALGQLLTDFAGHERLPHTIHEIAEQCHESGTADRAKQLFQNALSEQAKSPQAIWLQMGLVISNVLLENGNAAWTAIETLLNDFTTDERCAEAVGQVAWCYRKLEEYENARTLYHHVVDNWPNKPRAIFSQRGIVLASISLGDDTEAEAATEKLLIQFSKDEHLPKVVSTIAETYRGLEEYEKARELHQYVLDNHSGSEVAIFSQRGVIISSIELGDDSRAEAGIDRLLSQFSSNEKIAKVAYQVGRKLNKKNDEKAGQLYQYVVDNRPDDEHAALAGANIGQIELRLGNDAAARAIFDRVLSDFSGHSILPKAIALMATGYWERAFLEPRQNHQTTERAKDYFRKAIAEYEKIINQFPDVPHTTAEAYHLAGEFYHRLGQDEKALGYFQTVVDNWPEYQYAWLALFRVADTYKLLMRAGVVPESEAEPAMKDAYERLLEDYPDCGAVRSAEKWLNYYRRELQDRKKSSEGGQK